MADVSSPDAAMPLVCAECGHRTTDAERCTACGADPSLEGRWELLEEVGAGAFGTTFRGRDRETGATVAIKEMLVRRATALKSLELFEREARILESIELPGVPRFHADFVREAGRNSAFYLVQEFVEGETLEARHGGRPIAPATAFRYAEGLLATLASLHALSPPVIHRDIKPANVMIRPDGSVVLIDFGSVRAALDSTSGGSTVAGTFGYMAPEQFLGRAVPATDIYGVGATLVALLSADDPQNLLGDRRAIDPNPLGLSSVWMQPLRRMLAEEADERPDALEALRWVRGALDAHERGAEPPPRLAPTRPVEYDALGEAGAEADDEVPRPDLEVFVEYPEMSIERLSVPDRRWVEMRRFKRAVLESSVTVPPTRERHASDDSSGIGIATGVFVVLLAWMGAMLFAEPACDASRYPPTEAVAAPRILELHEDELMQILRGGLEDFSVQDPTTDWGALLDAGESQVSQDEALRTEPSPPEGSSPEPSPPGTPPDGSAAPATR